jgi:hypothetical protein
MPFEILVVDSLPIIGDEQLGSKNKFWFLQGQERWLFKESRAGTGEDWSEKIAAEVARLANVSAAAVDLAIFRGRVGSASRSFIARDDESLVHGNEVLGGQILGYDQYKKLHQSGHTLENIGAAIAEVFELTDEREAAQRSLAQYFTLDALIGNTVRHHENWGLLVSFERQDEDDYDLSIQVAPSFDHASSLGRELNDEKRLEILGRNAIASYARRGRGGIYLKSTDKKGANPLALVEFGLTIWPDAFQTALKLFAGVSVQGLHEIVDQVPEHRMSSPRAQLREGFHE